MKTTKDDLIKDYPSEYFNCYSEESAHQLNWIRLEYYRQFCLDVMKRINSGGRAFLEEEFPVSRVMKRWCDFSAGQFLNQKNLKFGKIWDKTPSPYMSEHQNIFRNSPTIPIEIGAGETMVYFGFVDLCPLLWVSKYRFPRPETVHFYGYDESELSVARSILIYEMLKTSPTEVSDKTILQTWFSSCWDRETKEQFEKFIKKKVPSIGNELLRNYAQIWMHKRNMSVKFAQESFSRNLNEVNLMALNNLELQQDRLFYARYLFTGCLFMKPKYEAVCGNCTMFPTSDDLFSRTKFEDFFNSVDIYTFSDKMQQCETTETFFGIIIEATVSQLHTLRKLIAAGKIRCHLFLKKISPKDFKFASEIQQLNPTLIDWSNLPDYWYRDTFLGFARNCQSAMTEHHFHSMNWIQRVYGASYIDFKDDKTLLEKLYSEYKKAKTEEALDKNYPLCFLKGYVRCPLFELPTNEFTEYAACKYGNDYLKYILTERNGEVADFEHEKKWLQVFCYNAGNLFCRFRLGSGTNICS